MRAALSLAISSVLLVACGGDKGQTGTEQQAIDYSQLQPSPQSTSALTSVDETKLGQYLKNGIRLQLAARNYNYPGGNGGVGAAPPLANDSSGGSGGFSDTNVHVQGVDEADYAKYDGSHWFVATYPQYQFNGQTQSPGFQIVATDPATPNAEIVGAFSFDKEWGDVASLYLVQQDEATSHVAAIRNQWGNVYPVLPGFPIAMLDVAFPAVTTDALIARPGPLNSKVRIQLVDVSTPAEPEQDWEIELDGSLIDSRKIGNTLYLITRFDPWLPELRFELGDSSIRDSNEDILQDAATEELLPHYRIGGSEYPLTRDCLVQEPISDRYGLGSLIHITALDLAGKKVLGSTCLNSNVEVMSMATDALYLTGTVYDSNSRAQSTVIHKFSLAETGAVYEATGNVIGALGWNSDPAFRLHEYEGDLRIVTSNRTNSGLTHHLTILRQRLNVLVTQGNLPNSVNPDPIGKPGEDIYAVRFVGTRAYIVTFQRTDPLYALDLTEPGQPRVLGKLEIPGFATYMHPIGENFLFTLGHSADEAGRVTGIKADLFDVSGDTPKVINTIGLGDSGSHSEALNNLRALSLLQNGDDQLRLALPLTRHLRTPTTGLQLLEVNGISSGKAELMDAGMLVAADGDVYYGAGVSRGILHDDAVFFAHNNMIWAANWDEPQNPVGPITKDPIACDASVQPSLRVTVLGDRTDDASVDFCQASVTAFWADEQYALEPIADADLIAPPDGRRPCTFIGPYEVSGEINLLIEMSGYQPEKLERIFVPRDICHVQTQEVSTVLKPE